MPTQLYEIVKNKTDFGYDEVAKASFRRACKQFFNKVDRILKDKYEVTESTYSFNPGGIAVNGDPAYKVMFKDGKGIYATACELYGDFQIMLRSIKDVKENSGGQNQWFPQGFMMEYKDTAKLIAKTAGQ